jgi:hypothetical protein
MGGLDMVVAGSSIPQPSRPLPPAGGAQQRHAVSEAHHKFEREKLLN